MSEYRKRAEECVQLALTARPHRRTVLLDIAMKWLELAKQDAETQALRTAIEAKQRDNGK